MFSLDLVGSQFTIIKVWAIFDTKPALNHWSVRRHRSLPPGQVWFTFMQILSSQTRFSRFQALKIGPQLLKRPVPAGCSNICHLVFELQYLKQPRRIANDSSGWLILGSYSGEPHTNFKLLNWPHNQPPWLVFSEQKTELEEHCPCISSKLFMRADSELPCFSLSQQNFNVMAPPGIEPSSTAHKAKTLPWS